MAGLTGRISTTIKAKVSKLLERAEDPSETLDYSYQKQVEQLQNVKKGIADVVTAKKRLQLQETSLQQQLVKLDTQARQAMSANKEDLARMALERKNVAQTELQGLDTQVKELEEQQEKLTDSEQKLRAKIEAFRTKKEVIKAQYSAAEAQVQISEAASGVGEQMADVGLAMQRAVDKTENMKARADAVSELEAAGAFEDITAIGSGEDDIDRQLKQLTNQSAVDDELGEDEGRARERGAGSVGRRARRGREASRGCRLGQRKWGASGAIRMIVRIAGEDQFRLDDSEQARVKELDEAVLHAVESGDQAGFQSSFAALLDLVRSSGSPLPDDDLEASDLILPPSDTTLTEAAEDFNGEGWLPD